MEDLLSRLLKWDPVTGIKRTMHANPDGTFTFETLQDVTAIVEDNKARMNSMRHNAGWKGDWHRVANIPLNIYFDLQRKGILDDEKALARWLNASENESFRTRPGRV